jgi:hypothetical protein
MNPHCSQYSKFGPVKWGAGVPEETVNSDIECVEELVGHMQALAAKAMKHHAR